MAISDTSSQRFMVAAFKRLDTELFSMSIWPPSFHDTEDLFNHGCAQWLLLYLPPAFPLTSTVGWVIWHGAYLGFPLHCGSVVPPCQIASDVDYLARTVSRVQATCSILHSVHPSHPQGMYSPRLILCGKCRNAVFIGLLRGTVRSLHFTMHLPPRLSSKTCSRAYSRVFKADGHFN